MGASPSDPCRLCQLVTVTNRIRDVKGSIGALDGNFNSAYILEATVDVVLVSGLCGTLGNHTGWGSLARPASVCLTDDVHLIQINMCTLFIGVIIV